MIPCERARNEEMTVTIASAKNHLKVAQQRSDAHRLRHCLTNRPISVAASLRWSSVTGGEVCS